MSEPRVAYFRPSLNKLFSNRLRGLIEDRFALSNVEKTKQEFQREYAVSLDCKIYNYAQYETRRIAATYPEVFPSPVRKEIEVVNSSMRMGLTAVGTVGLLYFGGGLFMKWAYKWGKLTASGLLPKALAYSCLINSTNFFVLVRNSDEMDIMLKHHIYYEQAIDKYQQNH